MNALPLVLIGLFAAPLCHAAIYVSPSGSDSAAGTKDLPVATAQQALELSLARADSTIIFADGVYLSDQPLQLNASHSGSADHPRLFKAEHEGKAIVSAGERFQVVWKQTAGGIYQAQLPVGAVESAAYDGLYIVGQQPRLARFPNYDRSARWLKGASADAFSAERIKTWKSPAGGILHAMHPAHWGGNHWTITGKKTESECIIDGGWMNNRGGGIHPSDRFVENIFEELDAQSEWYLDKRSGLLSFFPAGAFHDGPGSIILAKRESCVRIEGTSQSPVKHIQFDGISFRHTTRTFMKTKEPLLRSDWRIYRGGAVYLEGAEYISVLNSEFTDLGANAYFASGYNRSLSVSGCHFYNIGAGAVNFVGLSSAVYNAKFDPYGAPDHWDEINKQDKGPKSNEYPAHCVVSDSLIHDIGLVEKQVAGLQISIAHKVTAQHLSIYDVPRAGINIGENAFGGHLIEHCDVFDTVLESSDHGSFNSWGRDRFWHTNYGLVNQQVAEFPVLPLIDMLARNVIRNSRWRCDHGWDIDLDDGSSGCLVENNLCLGGGIKLREGFYRIVRNNLVVNNSFHPHLWFEKSGDQITSNIWATPTRDIGLAGKGALWDKNIYLTVDGLKKSQDYGVDVHGVVADLVFANPAALDFTFPVNAAVTQAGFKPFDLTQFGVQKLSLKAIARTPLPPKVNAATALLTVRVALLGATIKNVTTLGEISATGLPDQDGALFVDVERDQFFGKAGIQPNDVIRSVNGQPVRSCAEFLYAWASASRPVDISVWRTQAPTLHSLPPFPGTVLFAADAKRNAGSVYDSHKDFIGAWTSQQTSLTWTAALKSNTSYQILVDQASPVDIANSWKLEGLTTKVTETVVSSGDWESFVLTPADQSARSPESRDAMLTLSADQLNANSALMNLRGVFLIEDTVVQ